MHSHERASVWRFDFDLALMNINVCLQCFALGMITCLFDLNMSMFFPWI